MIYFKLLVFVEMMFYMNFFICLEFASHLFICYMLKSNKFGQNIKNRRKKKDIIQKHT